MIKIYTVGKMSGLTMNEQMEWRLEVEGQLRHKSDIPMKFYHPPLYFNYEEDKHKTEREVKEWELNHVLDCNVIVVNLKGINDSVGSHFELGVANAMNMFGKNHIYVIGFGDTNGVHPWIIDSLYRVEDDEESAAQYIADYLLE